MVCTNCILYVRWASHLVWLLSGNSTLEQRKRSREKENECHKTIRMRLFHVLTKWLDCSTRSSLFFSLFFHHELCKQGIRWLHAAGSWDDKPSEQNSMTSPLLEWTSERKQKSANYLQLYRRWKRPWESETRETASCVAWIGIPVDE